MYQDEAGKVKDLGASYMQQLAASTSIGSVGMKGGPAPDPSDHNNYRAWQSSQVWAPQSSTWQQALSAEQQDSIRSNQEMQQLLRRFKYAA